MNIADSSIKNVKHARHVKNDTAALYVNALIVALKFLDANQREKITTMLRAYLILGHLQHAVPEAAKGPESRQLFWPQFQELTPLSISRLKMNPVPKRNLTFT